MTLTRASVESRFFTGATNPGGSHSSSATRTLSANRFQMLVTAAYSETALPAGPVVPTNTFGFTWDLLATMTQTVKTNPVTGYERYVLAHVWCGYTPAGVTGINTVDFGTINLGPHGTTDRASAWFHEQFRGFTSFPTDNGQSLILQQLAQTGADHDVIFGGEEAAHLVLPNALATVESLNVGLALVKWASSAQSTMYATDGTKVRLITSSSYPAPPSEVVLRNSQDIYFADESSGGLPGTYTAFAFELGEAPVAIDETSDVLSTVATIDHDLLIGVEEDQHHTKLHTLQSHTGGFLYKTGAEVTITNADFVAPTNAMVAVTYDTLSGITLIWTRTNGVWDAVEVDD